MWICEGLHTCIYHLRKVFLQTSLSDIQILLRRQGILECVIAIIITQRRRTQWLCPAEGEEFGSKELRGANVCASVLDPPTQLLIHPTKQSFLPSITAAAAALPGQITSGLT